MQSKNKKEMKNIVSVTALSLFIVCMLSTAFAGEKLTLFCGAAFKQPLEELVQLFMEKEKSGMEVYANYASISALYSQILFSRQGDIFIVPSPDLMEKARTKGVIRPDSTVSFGYIAPVINVLKGNPKNIRGLEDLARPGLRIALCNPKTVFIGMLAVEIIEKGLTLEKKNLLKKNLVVYAEDFSKLSFLLLLNQVDAIIGFHYLAEWYPDKVGTIKFKAEEIHRIGSGQAAILSYSKNIQSAQRFIDFLLSEEGENIFRKYHYFSTREEADAWIGARKPVGGTYVIPEAWFEN